MEEYFDRCTKGPPFKDNEDKKYEFSRLLSFINWPMDSPIFPLNLAKAGFYFSGHCDEVQCFKCGVVKADWCLGDEPNEMHRLLNPDCLLLAENNEEINVPFSRNVSNGEESSLIQRLNSVLEGIGGGTCSGHGTEVGLRSHTGETSAIGEMGEVDTSESVAHGLDNSSSFQLPEFELGPNESSIESIESAVPRSRSLGNLQSHTRQGVHNDTLTESRSSTFPDTNARVNANVADSAVFLDRASSNTSNTAETISQYTSLNQLTTKSKEDKKKKDKTSKKTKEKDKKSAKSAKTSANIRRGSESNLPTQRGHDIPPPTGECIGPLRFERNRLESFRNWPSNACVATAELAKCGFHYSGSADRVQCIFCKGVLRNWEEGDRPHIEHRKHFPRCPLVLGLKMGNVPLPLGQNVGSASSNPVQGGGRQPPNPAANVIDCLSNMETLGIITDRPKQPQYAIESKRLASFQSWPAYKHQTPQQLAEAGFWYAGFNDNVKCFYCDGGLRNWDPGDEPWKEHARWFPKCPYVIQVKSQEFINSVLLEKGVEPPALANVQEPGFSSTTNDESSGVFWVEEREIRARMDRPYIRKVLDLGISRNVVMNTIRNRLRETGDDFPSVTTMMEAIFKEEAEEARRQSQNPSQSQNATESQTGSEDSAQKQSRHVDPTVSQSVVTKGSTDQEYETSEADKVSDATKSDITADMTVHMQADDLMKENLELKEQRLCKICMVSDANVVFLPCGHLVSCAACAPALQLCPICRASIKGTVRTYIA